MKRVASPIRPGKLGRRQPKRDISRWYMPVFSVAALVFLLHLSSGSESVQADTPTSQQPSAKQMRQAELGDAAQELRLHLNQLEKLIVASPDGTQPVLSVSPESSVRWRSSLQEIKAHYQIWGTTNSQHPDAASEDAIRNAHLYLVSMESALIGATKSQDWAKVKELKANFNRSLSVVSAL